MTKGPRETDSTRPWWMRTSHGVAPTCSRTLASTFRPRPCSPGPAPASSPRRSIRKSVVPAMQFLRVPVTRGATGAPPFTTDSTAAGACGSLDQAALALGKRREALLAGDRLDDPVVVPGILRFLRRLDLHQVHVVRQLAVGSQRRVAGEGIVDLHGLERGNHIVHVVRTGLLDRPQVVQNRRVLAG